MTGIELYNNAVRLLGYEENSGNTVLTDRAMSGATARLNLVVRDLREVSGLPFQRVENLAADIALPEELLDIAACGVAGHIAAAEGDDVKQYFWSSEYEARRAKLTKIEKIQSVI